MTYRQFRFLKAIQEVGINKVFKYAFFSFWEVIFKCLVFSPLRIFWMRLFGAKIGKDVVFGNVRFMNLYRLGLKGLKVGDKCFIGDYAVFDLADGITLEDNVTLSEEVFVLTHTNVGYLDHPLQKYIPAFSKKVVFKNGSFVGIRATIMPGIVVGEKSAVGACSLILKDVAPHELHAGVPAKFIKKFE